MFGNHVESSWAWWGLENFSRYTPHMSLRFNTDLFLNTFDGLRSLKGLSTKAACTEAGVDHLVVWRMRSQGYVPYVVNMSKLLLWMSDGVDADLLPYMDEAGESEEAA